MNQTISFSGSHGTGKSTAAGKCYDIEKLRNPSKKVFILVDQERFCPYPINEFTSEDAQAWIFANQIKKEQEARAKFDILITDRTLIDIAAYTHVAGYTSLAEGMLAYAEYHIQHYSQIHVKRIAVNPFCYQDGARAFTDPGFRQAVEETMLDLYGQLITSGHIGRGVLSYE